MVITYYGVGYFKVQFGDTVLALGPIGKDSKESGGRFGADIALLPLPHPDFAGAEQVTYGGKEPFVIRGPGEYEVKEVFIKGIAIPTTYAGEERRGVAYTIRLEDMDIVYLGPMASTNLTPEQWEQIENVDILIVPIGGEGQGVLSTKEAHKLAVNMEAKVIIPMMYDQDSLKKFTEEDSDSKTETVDKLTIKPRDVAGRETDIIVVTPSK